jgi:hypothetical protein
LNTREAHLLESTSEAKYDSTDNHGGNVLARSTDKTSNATQRRACNQEPAPAEDIGEATTDCHDDGCDKIPSVMTRQKLAMVAGIYDLRDSNPDVVLIGAEICIDKG